MEKNLVSCIIGFAILIGTASASASVDELRNYGYIYWENGNPKVGRRDGKFFPPAQDDPNVIVQTGYYSLRLDCDDIELTGYDALAGSDYMSALTENVSVFNGAALSLLVQKDGVSYMCRSGEVLYSEGMHVRLIESGQFVQRFDHTGLVFTDNQGNDLGVLGRLEITAWPDRVSFLLDFRDLDGNPVTTGLSQATINLIPPDLNFAYAIGGDHVSLTVQPHLGKQLYRMNADDYITEAKNADTQHPINVWFDEDRYALTVDLDTTGIRIPAEIDKVHEYVIEVTNPKSTAQNIPIVFDEGYPVSGITGTTMLLLDEAHKAPSGIPVQLSKNWHRTYKDLDGDGAKDDYVPVLYDGPWVRGSTVVTLAGNETRRFRLKVVCAHWGGLPAASHAQLSLIGYAGRCWTWEQSALGCWGESLCFDPTQHQGGSFLTDIRPSFTTSYVYGGSTYNWTENVGGGDFLYYRDKLNHFHFQKQLKTAYRWVGPNLTEIHYSGLTDDDKIRFTYVNQLGRTYDYQRRFLKFKYEFLDNVQSPQRLVFFQMAADRYMGPDFINYYIGDENGLIGTHQADVGGNQYKGSFNFEQCWLTMDDLIAGGNHSCYARRGIIARNMNFTPYMYLYGRSWGEDKMLFNLSSSNIRQSYGKNDVIEGELEFIMPAKSPADYWGKDQEFARRLSTYTEDWQAVYDEFRYNDQMTVTTSHGEVIEDYPITIKAASGTILADVTIAGGGVGAVPIILKGVPAGGWVNCQRRLNGEWKFLENVDIQNSDYYQGYKNAGGTMDYVFNINRPTTDLNESWRIRILKGW